MSGRIRRLDDFLAVLKGVKVGRVQPGIHLQSPEGKGL
jgi:hypothetical protein